MSPSRSVLISLVLATASACANSENATILGTAGSAGRSSSVTASTEGGSGGMGGITAAPANGGVSSSGGTSGTAGTSGSGPSGTAGTPNTGALGTAGSTSNTGPYICKKGAVTVAQLAPGKNGTWGTTIGIVGGAFSYAKTAAEKFTVDTAAKPGESKLTGTILVNSYSGYGLYFKDPEKCFDIMSSAWTTGIRITIGGTLGGAKLAFQFQQNNNYPVSTTDGKGACTGTWSSGCANNSKQLTIPETPAAIDIKWEELTGGEPDAVNPADAIGFQLHVDCPSDASASCPVALTIGEVVLF